MNVPKPSQNLQAGLTCVYRLVYALGMGEAMNTKDIPQRELQPGDSIVFLSKLHRVTGFDTYDGPFEFIDRVVCVEGHGRFMALEHHGWVTVAA